MSIAWNFIPKAWHLPIKKQKRQSQRPTLILYNLWGWRDMALRSGPRISSVVFSNCFTLTFLDIQSFSIIIVTTRWHVTWCCSTSRIMGEENTILQEKNVTRFDNSSVLGFDHYFPETFHLQCLSQRLEKVIKL